jgi:hypothetical protein
MIIMMPQLGASFTIVILMTLESQFISLELPIMLLDNIYIQVLELPIMLLDNIYITGNTLDNCH